MDHITNGRARGRSTHRAKAGIAAGAFLLTGSLIGWTAAGTGVGGASAGSVSPAAPPTERTIGASGDSYAPIVDEVAPAVVTIKSQARGTVSQQVPDDPLLREFFGDQFGRRRQVPERRREGLGSGVIVRTDGYVLTNHHVVDGAEQVTVELTDGRTFRAKVVGSDPPSDLAVLKIDGRNLKTLALGDSNAVRVGDVVLAVGNPLGIGQTVTMGIVSAKGRATGGSEGGSFEDFIQTDAPINQGNSGGALVSTRGELIGINSQIVSPSGGNIGIGFSIPANMARNVMTQLIDNGRVQRGLLGVTIQPVTSDIARSLGLSDVRGALISDVTPGSAADKGGARRGDVIIAINGDVVKDGNVLRNQIAQLLPGSNVRVTVLRDGQERMINVTLAELKTSASTGTQGSGDDSTGYGMTVEPMTGAAARQLEVDSTGVIVTGVQPSGRAADAGLRSGDVISQVDGKPVQNVDAFKSALSAGGRPALLLVHRGGVAVFVTIERIPK